MRAVSAPENEWSTTEQLEAAPEGRRLWAYCHDEWKEGALGEFKNK